MQSSIVLQWHYMVFLAPAGASALLLLLSGLRLGGHRSHHHGGHSARPVGGAATARHGHSHGVAGARHTGRGAVRTKQEGNAASAHPTPNLTDLILAIFGIGRLPLLLMVQMFCLCGGIAGFWANQLLLGNTPSPTLGQWLPSLYIALGGGVIGSRVAGEIIVRLMPKEESAIVGRDGLFGLVGKVVYTVDETAGRIHIYDPFGTLHDETCRIAPGHAPIEKGGFARIMDRDRSGRFLVEEASEPVKLS